MPFLGARIWRSRARTGDAVKWWLGWLGSSYVAHIMIGIHCGDLSFRMIGFVTLMCPFFKWNIRTPVRRVHRMDALQLQILSCESLNLCNGSQSWCLQRSSTLINSIITLQHCPYEPVSTKFVLLKSTSYGGCVGAPTRIVLPFIRTTDTLKVQILSCDVLCH